MDNIQNSDGENEWKRTENVGRIAMLNKMAREMASAKSLRSEHVFRYQQGVPGGWGWVRGGKTMKPEVGAGLEVGSKSHSRVSLCIVSPVPAHACLPGQQSYTRYYGLWPWTLETCGPGSHDKVFISVHFPAVGNSYRDPVWLWKHFKESNM